MKNSRRGSMIIEACVALPLLLIFLFGGLEFAWAFTKKVEVSNAARVGARAASLYTSTYAQVQSAVSGQMESAGFPEGAWTLELTPTDPSMASPGDPVSLRISTDSSSVSLGGLADWFPVPDTISSQAVMRKEGGQ